MILSFDGISPFPVTVIRVVIRHQHPAESLFFQFFDIFFDHDFSIHGTFFGMAMHIELHIPSPLFVQFS